MKKIWMCDFCIHTEEDKEKMTKHEEKCGSNPAKKECYSCKHHSWGPHTISGHMEECAAGIASHTMWEIQEDKLPCEKWAEE